MEEKNKRVYYIVEN